MELQAYIDTHKGANIGNTPENKGECVGYISVYFDTWKASHVYGNANQLYANAGADYDKGTNWPAPRGAAATFGKPYGYIGGVYYGHTGLSLGDGRLAQQNDPDGSLPAVKKYTNNGYIGWIRPKSYKEGGEVTDLSTERRLAFWIYGINGVYDPKNALNGDIDAQLNKSVGRDTNVAIQQMTDDQYGQAYKKYLGSKPGNYKPVTDQLYTKG